MRAPAEREKGFVDVRAAFVAQRGAAEAMQPGQGAFDNPAEDAEAAHEDWRAWRALDAAGVMEAENAPTAPWKSLRDFYKRPRKADFPAKWRL
jgi:hypothetical protein